MRTIRSRSLILAALALLVCFGTTATGYAFWQSAAAGVGDGRSDSTQPLLLAPATVSADLYPGGLGDVGVTVQNPNAGEVRLTSLAVDTGLGTNGYGVDAGHGGCALTALAFAPQDNGGAGWTIAGNQTVTLTLTDSLAMSTGAVDACQGATFTVYLEAVPS